MTQKTITEKQQERAKNIYILFALGAALCFSSISFLILSGILAVIIGIFMAYAGRRQTEDKVLKSHHRWQIRTFWIGNLVLIPVALLANLLLLYLLTDIDVIFSTAARGQYGADIATMQQVIIDFETQNALTLLGVKLATYGLVLVWWLRRCWLGYEALKAGKPSPIPAS